jgi:4-diphosphocytidyl-2-C-methyl-D-erythritol kinase
MIIEKYGASAKINLFLEVIDKRKDGYHNIKSIFARVGIEDRIEISLDNASDKISLSVVNNSNASDISNSDNLVYRAAALFIREF